MNFLQKLNFKWYPTNEDIEKAEKRMFSNLKTPYQQKLIKVGDNYINTIEMGQDGKEILVLVHGFAAGIGFWTGSLDYLSEHYKIYAFDLPGFGRSSRPDSKHITTKEDAEKFWTKSMYDWSEEMGLKKFNLLGHSLGGYLSGSFAIDYPDKVQKLILLDPWGLPEFNPNVEIPLAAKILSKVVSPGLGIVRLSGPKLISKVRSDLLNKFGGIHPIEPTDGLPVNTVANYIYHSNSQLPATGESLFKLLALPMGWAANPLKNRLKSINPDIDITFIYGQNSWITSKPAYELKPEMKNIKNIIIIPDSGHHIYIDNIPEFHASIHQSIPVESIILKEAMRQREQLHSFQNVEFNRA